MYRKYFFYSFQEKDSERYLSFFWQLVRNDPAGGRRYEHRNKLQLVF